MKQITLKRLDILKNEEALIYENYKIATTSITEIVALLVSQNGLDELDIQLIPDFTGKLYNRDYRMWRLNLVKSLQEILNLVSITFNDQSMLLPPDYDEIKSIELYLPLTNSFDAVYKSGMNDDFDVVEKRINNLYLAMNDAGLTI